jgi:hypothetical protein
MYYPICLYIRIDYNVSNIGILIIALRGCRSIVRKSITRRICVKQH